MLSSRPSHLDSVLPEVILRWLLDEEVTLVWYRLHCIREIEAASVLWIDRPPVPQADHWPAESDRGLVHLVHNPLGRMAADMSQASYGAFVEREEELLAIRRVLLLQVAARLHVLEHGAPPSALGELADRLGSLDDPFSEGALELEDGWIRSAAADLGHLTERRDRFLRPIALSEPSGD